MYGHNLTVYHFQNNNTSLSQCLYAYDNNLLLYIRKRCKRYRNMLCYLAATATSICICICVC